MDENSLLTTKWYTPAEAIKILQISKSTFWRKIHDGSIKHRQDGPKTYRISETALLDYLKRVIK